MANSFYSKNIFENLDKEGRFYGQITTETWKAGDPDVTTHVKTYDEPKNLLPFYYDVHKDGETIPAVEIVLKGEKMYIPKDMWLYGDSFILRDQYVFRRNSEGWFANHLNGQVIGFTSSIDPQFYSKDIVEINEEGKFTGMSFVRKWKSGDEKMSFTQESYDTPRYSQEKRQVSKLLTGLAGIFQERKKEKKQSTLLDKVERRIERKIDDRLEEIKEGAADRAQELISGVVEEANKLKEKFKEQLLEAAPIVASAVMSKIREEIPEIQRKLESASRRSSEGKKSSMEKPLSLLTIREEDLEFKEPTSEEKELGGSLKDEVEMLRKKRVANAKLESMRKSIKAKESQEKVKEDESKVLADRIQMLSDKKKEMEAHQKVLEKQKSVKSDSNKLKSLESALKQDSLKKRVQLSSLKDDLDKEESDLSKVLSGESDDLEKVRADAFKARASLASLKETNEKEMKDKAEMKRVSFQKQFDEAELESARKEKLSSQLKVKKDEISLARDTQKLKKDSEDAKKKSFEQNLALVRLNSAKKDLSEPKSSIRPIELSKASMKEELKSPRASSVEEPWAPKKTTSPSKSSPDEEPWAPKKAVSGFSMRETEEPWAPKKAVSGFSMRETEEPWAPKKAVSGFSMASSKPSTEDGVKVKVGKKELKLLKSKVQGDDDFEKDGLHFSKVGTSWKACDEDAGVCQDVVLIE